MVVDVFERLVGILGAMTVFVTLGVALLELWRSLTRPKGRVIGRRCCGASAEHAHGRDQHSIHYSSIPCLCFSGNQSSNSVTGYTC